MFVYVRACPLLFVFVFNVAICLTFVCLFVCPLLLFFVLSVCFCSCLRSAVKRRGGCTWGLLVAVVIKVCH